MNRNSQERFALNPVNIDIQRSRFDMTPEVKTTFNLGDIVPIGMPLEILPGDTFQIDLALALRMQSLATAPFDNLHYDYYFFYVPSRLCWSHWREFMGENTESAWIPQVEYNLPMLDFVGGATPGSIADYFGIPTNIGEGKHLKVNALPFRGFALIYNEWFRDENIIAPVNVSLDDVDRNGMIASNPNYSDPKISVELGGILPKAAKTRDYFTSALPGPQKGEDVMVFDHLPVYFDSSRHNEDVVEEHGLNAGYLTTWNGAHTELTNYQVGAFNSSGQLINTALNNVQPNNWFVDGSLSINQLRLAFQIQKLYEKNARGGSRYVELLKSHFGVTAPDASLQRPQYLGGKRISININQILQTSESNETPQGNVAGYSLTSEAGDGDVIQSFTEHGYLYCIGVSRIDQHTYQQGLHRMWTRRDNLDFYYPVLANVGEQPILNKEIYAQGLTAAELDDPNTAEDNEVFGYQEAWAEYRYMPSIVTGNMRSNISNSLDSWHFADYYTQLPSLSEGWINEDSNNIVRSLAVEDTSLADQFFGDFRFKIRATRPMPLYSVPGLIDHH